MSVMGLWRISFAHGGCMLLGVLGVFLLSACTTPQPKNIDDVCEMFDERYRWYTAAKESERQYGIPIGVTMAFIHQESKFIADNRPPRTKFFWFIPGKRPSSAYGYPQALDTTWREYQRSTENWSARRTRFSDAVDFIGWYNQRTVQRAGVAPHDAYRLYLAYHEGIGGFQRGTHNNKPWLLQVAAKVQRRATQYQQQLAQCQRQLDRHWFWRSLWGDASTTTPLRLPSASATHRELTWDQAQCGPFVLDAKPRRDGQRQPASA